MDNIVGHAMRMNELAVSVGSRHSMHVTTVNRLISLFPDRDLWSSSV